MPLWLEHLRFASDATLLGLAAGAFALLAVIAWLADLRRMRRKQPDAVGWVPWTSVYVLSLFTALVLLLFAAKGWIGG